MKVFIVAWAIVILYMSGLVFSEDNYNHERELIKLKYVSEEAAAAAAQYQDASYYKDGKFVFNETEGDKAAAYIIQQDLKLDNNFNPTSSSYWKQKVTYTVQYFDDSNTKYPYLYTDPKGVLNHVITSPTVVVSIDAGKARYRLISNENIPEAYRVAAHSWKDR